MGDEGGRRQNTSGVSTAFGFLRVVLKQKWQNLRGYLIWMVGSLVFVTVLSTLLCVLTMCVYHWSTEIKGGKRKAGWTQIKEVLGCQNKKLGFIFQTWENH